MNEIDIYAGFAERYDLMDGSFDDNDPVMVEFFRQIFVKNHVTSTLDCACGTGQHLLLFHKLGLMVRGSDASQAMLAQARRNLSNYGVEVNLRQADYRELPEYFNQDFDAVVCLGSIGYMPDETQFIRAFRSMYSVIKEGGIMIMTSIVTDKQWREQPRFKLSVDVPEITRLFVMDYLYTTVEYNIVDIYHNQEVGGLKVWSAELTVLLQGDQERLLKASGFQEVNFYGAFDFSSYDKKNSDLLITVAYK